MRDESLFYLFSSISRIKGVGTATSLALQRLLPRATSLSGSTMPIIRDLLFHLPVGMLDRRFMPPLGSAPDGVIATFVVKVDGHYPPAPDRRGRRPYKVECSNDTGTLTLIFFNAHADYIAQVLPIGSRRVVSGRTEHFEYRLQMTHPDVIATLEKLEEVKQPDPVYPLTIGLNSKRIAKMVETALEKLPELPEWIDTHNLPPPLRGRAGMGGISQISTYYTHDYTETAIDNAKDLRNNPTDAEIKLWQLLRGKQLEPYKFRRQQPIGNYIVDFYCPEAKFIIELDGGQHADQKSYDDKRTQFLEAQGHRVLRFWNNDVQENIESVYQVITTALQETPSPLEGEGEYLPTWKSALQRAHHPQSTEELLPTAPARMRLAYDEMLANQLQLCIMRRNRKRQSGAVIKGTGELTDALLASLPFTLTEGQRGVLTDIYTDMASGGRMGRLLQGDVGSGKTIVALLAMLRTVEEGMQAALMVPTEIIAQQHYETLTRLTSGLGVTIGLLTGNIKGKAREAVLEGIANGRIDILVGTHALFQEHVVFKCLSLAVIDEQHRFGVAQRMALTSKGNATHLLHMTATPIPRSLTMTFYGDMECSLLKEKPAERQPITTRTIALSRYKEIMERLKAALDKGEKAYWICPLIEEKFIEGELELTPEQDIAAAETRFTEFKTRFGPIVGMVHGKMKSGNRDAEMQRFARGNTRLLVATTVVEVGVDVRDATIIVIEKAERFGLSQLHQLRGRVGRGSKPSACVLLYSESRRDSHANLDAQGLSPAQARLAIMRDTEDGFRIAEADLHIRGGGELLGSRQSGLPRFIFTSLHEHQQLLEHARADADQFLQDDPEFASERGKSLQLLLQLFER